MTAILWTQSATVTWRPTVGYYEHRFEYLRALEERGLVAAFRVDDSNNVEVKLVDPHHQATLGPGSLALDVATPTGDWGRCLAALELATSYTEPREVRSVRFQFQIVAPVEDMDYDDARQAYSAGWLGRLPGYTLSDIAVLADFDLEDGFASGQVEFGVISDEELGPRVSRHAGRMAIPARQRGQLGDLDTEVPRVAVFVDMNWQLTRIPKGEPPRWIHDARERLVKESLSLTDTLTMMSSDGG